MKSLQLLKNLNMPFNDSIVNSNKKFEDGADYRIEVPTINSLEALETLLNIAKTKNIKINRVTTKIAFKIT